MRSSPILVLIGTLLMASTVWSRVFVLPGISYDSDVGGVAVLYVFFRDQHPGRIAFSGTYTTRGSQWYSFEAVRPWKGAEWDVYLSYFLGVWNRYDPVDTDYHDPLVEVGGSGVDFRLGSEIPLSDGVCVGGLLGYKTFRFFDFELEEELHPGAIALFHDTQESWTNLDETYLGVRITRDRRDNRYHTLRGTYLRLEYHLVHLSAGINPYALRTIGDFRVAAPLWDRPDRRAFPRLVWAQMASAGYIFSDVPDPVLFRIGGGSNLRGFPWRRFEGRGMALYRNELRLTLVDELPDPFSRIRTRIRSLPVLKPALELAVFADIGTTWYERLHRDHIESGYGCGFRLILPADVVCRIDVALPDDGHYWGLYLNLSQSF